MLDYLIEENRVLKEQLEGRALRLTDDQRRRLAAKGKRIGRRLLMQVATIVTPDTILRWQHPLIAIQWTYPSKRVGRPGLMRHIRELILKSHWDQIAATDFFTIEVWTLTGLKTYYVLFMIELDTRRVHWAGITRHPNDMWMGHAAERAARFLKGRRFMIRDGAANIRYRFKIVMEEAGIKLIRTPYQAPNANVHAERFIRSIKDECLNRMIVFGEAHLRRTIDEFLVHYNHERNHQGIGNEWIDARADAGAGQVECTERLGGLLEFYRRSA